MLWAGIAAGNVGDGGFIPGVELQEGTGQGMSFGIDPGEPQRG